MTRTIVSTENAPAAVGPYSQGVILDGWLWTCGQVALDPSSGELVGENAAGQAHQDAVTRFAERLHAPVYGAHLPLAVARVADDGQQEAAIAELCEEYRSSAVSESHSESGPPWITLSVFRISPTGDRFPFRLSRKRRRRSKRVALRRPPLFH